MQSIINARMKYKKAPMSVFLFVNKTVKELQYFESTINFNINYNESLSEVYIFIDEYRLTQVMSNLLKNAVHFGNARDVEIIIQRINENIRISITDHGDGISEKHQNTVFDCYVKSDQYKNQNHVGSV
jgi:signal transduction histidine kinase